MGIDVGKLREKLVRRNLAQWQLAKELDLPPSTFSGYVRGARPAPPNLRRRIEKALGLKDGDLTSHLTKQNGPHRA